MSIKQNLDIAIEKSLYNEIIEGRWIPNERIKIERIMDEYSVSRMGMDGTGSVKSVMNVSPDAKGNISLSTAVSVDEYTLHLNFV